MFLDAVARPRFELVRGGPFLGDQSPPVGMSSPGSPPSRAAADPRLEPGRADARVGVSWLEAEIIQRRAEDEDGRVYLTQSSAAPKVSPQPSQKVNPITSNGLARVISTSRRPTILIVEMPKQIESMRIIHSR
jgi:hypothetical protein